MYQKLCKCLGATEYYSRGEDRTSGKSENDRGATAAFVSTTTVPESGPRGEETQKVTQRVQYDHEKLSLRVCSTSTLQTVRVRIPINYVLEHIYICVILLSPCGRQSV